MKYLVFFASIFFSINSFACPNLSGTYQCSVDSEDPQDTGVISIEFDKTTPAYVVMDHDSQKSEIYPADNKEHIAQDGSTYKGWCEDNSFKYIQSQMDSQFGLILGEVTLKLNSEGHLDTLGVLTFAGKQYELKDLCRKL